MWRKSAKNPKISLKKISHHPRITSRIYLKKIYTVNSSKFLSPNVWADDLWSRNLCSFATAKKKRDIYLLRFIAVASVKQWKTNKINKKYRFASCFRVLSNQYVERSAHANLTKRRHFWCFHWFRAAMLECLRAAPKQTL